MSTVLLRATRLTLLLVGSATTASIIIIMMMMMIVGSIWEVIVGRRVGQELCLDAGGRAAQAELREDLSCRASFILTRLGKSLHLLILSHECVCDMMSVNPNLLLLFLTLSHSTLYYKLCKEINYITKRFFSTL